MRVWVYPERKYEELGAARYQLSWEQVKPGSVGKDEIDPDIDVEYCFKNFKSKAVALKAGRKLVDGYRTAYGTASVTKQVVDWYVEKDRIAEWANTSEEEHID